MGAWIETERGIKNFVAGSVAPRVGAWIETQLKERKPLAPVSHPVWVRGLKQNRTSGTCRAFTSHPVWVRGLKHEVYETLVGLSRVAPRVGAWIETKVLQLMKEDGRSHPVWVRGLKRTLARKVDVLNAVAPRVGAWIETTVSPSAILPTTGRTPCGCVD